jgi:hypothetical protein
MWNIKNYENKNIPKPKISESVSNIVLKHFLLPSVPQGNKPIGCHKGGRAAIVQGTARARKVIEPAHKFGNCPTFFFS